MSSAALRGLHAVGSYPAGSAEEAMGELLDTAGPHLRSVPDGETGERRAWLMGLVEGMRSHPDLEVRTEGRFRDYGDLLTFRVRRGHRLTSDDLDLGIAAAHAAAWPSFRALRTAYGRSDLAFQVGVPGVLDFALFVLGPAGALTRRRVFADAIVREITEVHRVSGDDVVFQLEFPTELAMTASVPGPARAAAAAWIARTALDVVRRAPDGARFGVHLCLGDLHHRPLTRLRNCAPLVTLVNAVLRRWPPGRRLEFVHLPLAAGDRPAPIDAAFYARLATLRTDGSTRLVAGLLHEDPTSAQLRDVLAAVESAVGRRVDVAASCGLGRVPRDTARHVLLQGVELCR